METKNILEKLIHGDIVQIAKMTNYSYKTVWSQLNGVRTLKPKVVQAAELIIKAREEAIKKYNEQNTDKK